MLVVVLIAELLIAAELGAELETDELMAVACELPLGVAAALDDELGIALDTELAVELAEDGAAEEGLFVLAAADFELSKDAKTDESTAGIVPCPEVLDGALDSTELTLVDAEPALELGTALVLDTAGEFEEGAAADEDAGVEDAMADALGFPAALLLFPPVSVVYPAIGPVNVGESVTKTTVTLLALAAAGLGASGETLAVETCGGAGGVGP